MKMINIQCLDCKQESVQSIHFYESEIVHVKDDFTFSLAEEKYPLSQELLDSRGLKLLAGELRLA